MPRFQVHQGDAVEWLRTVPDAVIDLVITDPPYESLEKHRAIGTTTRLKHSKASSNDWFTIFPNARFPELFAEIYRVLKKDRHFYFFCDHETMFVAKPAAEQAGFKFWKPLIWDKCLGPDTPVWTNRGVIPIGEVNVGDRVALPEAGTTEVRATRRTRAPSLRLSFSDGTSIIASRDHRFVLGDGTQIEASRLQVGSTLCTRPVRDRARDAIALDEVIPEDEVVYQLPDTKSCLWCGQRFQSIRAAAAHQARFCREARSKLEMALVLGVRPKRLRRWLEDGRIPRQWAQRLGLQSKLGPRVQCHLQNDFEVWYPRSLPLDYALGRLVGLFAAEGSFTAAGVSFAFHSNEKHLHAHVAQYVRAFGVRARPWLSGNTFRLNVDFKVIGYLLRHFVGGSDAVSKFFTPAVYEAPAEFRRGVLAGLLGGDGHWSHEEQRQTLNIASLDLAMFVRRELESLDHAPRIRAFDNASAGGWRVRYDPVERWSQLSVTEITELGEQDLVDISIADGDELFLLGNGIVTHNCKIGMGYHYRARYECVLFFEKGKRKLNDLGLADIIEVPRVHNGYPAEKPVDVARVLIEQSSAAGELVVDPFMGSGSTGVAAVRTGRDFLGNDLCEEAVRISRLRLGDEGASSQPLAQPLGAAQLAMKV